MRVKMDNLVLPQEVDGSAQVVQNRVDPARVFRQPRPQDVGYILQEQNQLMLALLLSRIYLPIFSLPPQYST